MWLDDTERICACTQTIIVPTSAVETSFISSQSWKSCQLLLLLFDQALFKKTLAFKIIRTLQFYLLLGHTLETMRGPVCPLNWRTVFICFYIVLNLCFVHFNKMVTEFVEIKSELY